MAGDHPIETCETVTTDTLRAVFDELEAMGVDPADGNAAKGLTRYRGQGLMSSRLLFHRPST